jgi:hypothetical protein
MTTAPRTAATTGFGTISGTVHVSGGLTPDTVCAQAYTADTFAFVDSQCATAAGAYTLQLPVGSYVIGFGTDTCCEPLEYYNGKFSAATADPVTVSDSVDTPNIDVSFGSISGTVTEAGTHQQLANICANVFRATDVDPNDAITYACTDNVGHYSVGPLLTGTYVVEFIDSKGPHVDTWYNGKTSGQDADLINVTAGVDTANIDTEMAIGGQITGHVTDAVTSAAVSSVCVEVYDATTEQQVDNARCTDDFGSYITGGLPVGDYRLYFNVYDGTHVPQWYDGQSTFETATTVHVSAGAPTTADAALVQGRTISGTVTDQTTGNPIQDARVDVLSTTGDWLGIYAYTAADGTFTTPALSAGSYLVFFNAPWGSPYQSQWYNDKPDSTTADQVAVGTSSDISGINAALASGGTVSGTITDAATHAPIVDACVDVQPADFSVDGYGCTDETGHDTTSGVPTGSYTVYISDYSGPYLAATYGATDANPAGTPVSVTAGADTSGIDAALVRGAQFKGTITDAVTGVPLSNICAYAVDATTGNYFSNYSSCTNADGTYTTAGVPTGDYDLEFDNSQGRYVTQWYVHAPDQASATPIHANVGVDVTGIDVQMVLGGAVSGTVTDAASSPLPGICVTLYLPDGNFGGDGGCTDDSGKYTSSEVAPGTYKVGFYDPNNGYASEYYNDKPDLASADTIQITAGATTSGIDAALAQQTGGDLSGTVLDTNSNEQFGAYVQACNPTVLHTGGGCRFTTDQGGFYFSNLPAATYVVTAFAPNGSDLLPATRNATVVTGGLVSTTLTLKAPTPLPSGSSITDGNGGVVAASGSVPTLQWQDSYTINLTGCANGTGTLTVTAKDAYTGANHSVPVSLTESPAGSGNYVGTVPELYPVYGQGSLAWTITCGSTHTTGNVTVYIDPSGTIEDQNGHPISGATVTLLRSDTEAGPFLAVPDGSETMSPNNRSNPMLSAADGSYGWDVIAGFYKVKATRAGCSTETSNVLTIPPAVTALVLQLTCNSGVDVTAPTVSIDTHPSSLTRNRSAAFTFSGSDADSPPVTYTCSLDGGAQSACSSGQAYAALADGLHVFAVVGHDAAGNFSLPVTFGWRVDGTKPSATVTAPTSPFTLAKQITVRWSGSDNGSGIDHYQLRYRRAASTGNFPKSWTTPSSWSTLKVTKATASVAAGYDYCFQVRAVDRAGNVSGWSSSKCTAAALDDRALKASTGWARRTGRAYYLGTVTSGTQKGATLSKSGLALDRLAVVVTKCSGCGSIAVFVGSKKVGTVNLSASVTKNKVIVTFPRFSFRTGTVTLKVLSSGKKVLIDGLGVSRT